MASIAFTPANIFAYEDIPYQYPILWGTPITSVDTRYTGKQVKEGIVPTPNGIFFTWLYPLVPGTADNDVLVQSAAVGYRALIFEGKFSAGQVRQWALGGPSLGNPTYQYVSNIRPPSQYVILSRPASGQLTVPPGILEVGTDYTLALQALMFFTTEPDIPIPGQPSPTQSTSHFCYSEWASVNFRVDQPPSASNLRVNGLENPTRVPTSLTPTFSFTVSDPDGPSLNYKVEVGTYVGGTNTWSSGEMAATPSATGSTEISLPYSGPTLSRGIPYYWKVTVDDGLVASAATDGTARFQINTPPTVLSLKADGSEMIDGEIPLVKNVGVELTWQFYDADGDEQAAYQLVVGKGGKNVLVSGEVPTDSQAVTIPPLLVGEFVTVSLKVKDGTEYGQVINGSFRTDSKPSATNLLIDGQENPGYVSSPTPTFSWTYTHPDASGGTTDLQRAYRLQVASDANFASVIWDTGTVTSPLSSVTYNGTTPLGHDMYYVRVKVSSSITDSDYTQGFFAINMSPNNPILISPAAGPYGSPWEVPIQWTPAFPLDPDGDAVTYTIETTETRSTNSGWKFLAGPIAAVSPTAPVVEYVVLAIMDGARYQDTMGAVGTPNVPNIAAIAATGMTADSMYSSDAADLPAKTETILGHATMGTGAFLDILNDGSQNPYYPSFMSEWLYHKGIPSNATVGITTKAKLITSKDKLWCLRLVSGPGFWNNYIPFADCGVNHIGGGGYRSDATTQSLALAEVNSATPPNLLWVSYKEPDSTAHAATHDAPGFASYEAAIQQTDAYIGQLWTAIQANPVMAGKTVIIIADDHGRQDPNWWSHGGITAPERQVMFVAAGPRIKAGTTSTPHRLKDVAPTILGLMGMSKTTGNGTFMSDITDYQDLAGAYTWDISSVRSGTNYGVRIIASDYFSSSDPSVGGTSVRFSILNHAPSTPVFTLPKSGDIANTIIKAEWAEADPVDVDGDQTNYIVEITRNILAPTPIWELVGIFPQGTSRIFVNSSSLPDGSSYRLRIKAVDSEGAEGSTNYSPTFSVSNKVYVNDFEVHKGRLYLGCSDGKLLRVKETMWQLEEDFSDQNSLGRFQEFSSGKPYIKLENGTLLISTLPGETFILRQLGD
jgi:hypothetical protein